MAKPFRIATLSIIGALLSLVLSIPLGTLAAEIDLDALKDQLRSKQAEVNLLDTRLAEYNQTLKELSGKSSSLRNDINYLDGQVIALDLDILTLQSQQEEKELRLRVLAQEKIKTELRLVNQKELLKRLLKELNAKDQGSDNMLTHALVAPALNGWLEGMAQLEQFSLSLKTVLGATKGAKAQLERDANTQTVALNSLLEIEQELIVKQDQLEQSKTAKVILRSQTKESENQYTVLVSELRSEQSAIESALQALQDEIQNRLLAEDDQNGGPTVITWPVDGIITALFHDPDYPFRNLFEHSGLDIAVPQGTAVAAAAPGVVAWAKTGKMYGNYIMIIHANGLATLYAHLSRLDVSQDQLVKRGQIIGLSGGRAGSAGAGFSTGPHLHFEVRQDGIPSNPLSFLP